MNSQLGGRVARSDSRGRIETTYLREYFCYLLVSTPALDLLHLRLRAVQVSKSCGASVCADEHGATQPTNYFWIITPPV
jgi:hypothetical protein